MHLIEWNMAWVTFSLLNCTFEIHIYFNHNLLKEYNVIWNFQYFYKCQNFQNQLQIIFFQRKKTLFNFRLLSITILLRILSIENIEFHSDNGTFWRNSRMRCLILILFTCFSLQKKNLLVFLFNRPCSFNNNDIRKNADSTWETLYIINLEDINIL